MEEATYPSSGQVQRAWALLRCLLLASALATMGPAWAAKTATSTTLSSSVNPSVIGQATVLTATVSPSGATGSVNFKDGNTTLGTATLSSGVATRLPQGCVCPLLVNFCMCQPHSRCCSGCIE